MARRKRSRISSNDVDETSPKTMKPEEKIDESDSKEISSEDANKKSPEECIEHEKTNGNDKIVELEKKLEKQIKKSLRAELKSNEEKVNDQQKPKNSKKKDSRKSHKTENKGDNDIDRKDKKTSEIYDEAFNARRKYILNKKDPPSAQEMKDKYPDLFNKDKVFQELELIFQKTSLFETFEKKSDLYYKHIWKLSNDPLKTKLELSLKDASEKTKTWIKKASSLLLMADYLEENRKGMIIFDYETVPDDHENRPYIRCQGDFAYAVEEESSFVINVEEVELCKVSTIIEAYFALIAAYYIFNAVYPKCCEKAFYFFERFYLDYDDNTDGISVKAKKKVDSLVKGITAT